MPTNKTDLVALTATDGPDSHCAYWRVDAFGVERHAGRVFRVEGMQAEQMTVMAAISQDGALFTIDFGGSVGRVTATLYSEPLADAARRAAHSAAISKVVQVRPPHEYRVAAERACLGQSMDRLGEFVRGPGFAKLDDLDRMLLSQQLAHMSLYYEDLGQRLNHWARKREQR